MLDLKKEEIQWVKENKDVILSIFKKFQDDIIDDMVNEEDDKKRDILRLFVKETKKWIPILEEIGKVKKTDNNPFTGV